MDKQNVVYPHNGVLFGRRKKWSTDPCYNMEDLKHIMWNERTQTHKRLHIVWFHLNEVFGIDQSIENERRRQWHPTPVLLPGKSHGQGSLVGCSPWGRWESGMTEQLHFHFSLSCIGEGNGSPLQCSCLENPRDGGAWWAVRSHRVRHDWSDLAAAAAAALTFTRVLFQIFSLGLKRLI